MGRKLNTRVKVGVEMIEKVSENEYKRNGNIVAQIVARVAPGQTLENRDTDSIYTNHPHGMA